MEETKGSMNLPASKLPVTEEPTDFRSSPHWRVFRIMSEFVDGWQFLADFKKTVTFFGSARFVEGNKWYDEARKLGYRLAKEENFAVITGGGPGIMEAGNRGAFEAEGDSIGLNIKLPFEQRINPYVKKYIAFHYFFVRKVMLSFAAQSYVFFPGGYGTMDEMFEILTLVQTKKIKPIPIILVGKEYWQHISEWVKQVMYEEYKAIDSEDMNLFTVVDSADEAFEIVRNSPPRTDHINEEMR